MIGGLLPRPALALMRAAQAGDVARACRLNEAFEPLWELFRRHGSVRVVHAATNLLKVTDAQPPRPILPLGTAERDCIARALERLASRARPVA